MQTNFGSSARSVSTSYTSKIDHGIQLEHSFVEIFSPFPLIQEEKVDGYGLKNGHSLNTGKFSF